MATQWFSSVVVTAVWDYRNLLDVQCIQSIAINREQVANLLRSKAVSTTTIRPRFD